MAGVKPLDGRGANFMADAANRDVANMVISETEGGLRINQYTVQRNVGITGMCLGAASIDA